MKRFESVEQILDFAITRELEAHDFYTELASRMGNPAMGRVLEAFAVDEMGHKMKLEAVKAGEFEFKEEQVQSLEITDYVVEGEAKPDMSYADALVLAMKKEKAAYRLYIDLAATAEALLGDASPLVRGMAVWALSRLLAPAAFAALKARHADPTDPATAGDLAFVRRMMLNMDPPEHTRLRRLLVNAFTPKAIAKLEMQIRANARAILDRALRETA